MPYYVYSCLLKLLSESHDSETLGNLLGQLIGKLFFDENILCIVYTLNWVVFSFCSFHQTPMHLTYSHIRMRASHIRIHKLNQEKKVIENVRNWHLINLKCMIAWYEKLPAYHSTPYHTMHCILHLSQLIKAYRMFVERLK